MAKKTTGPTAALRREALRKLEADARKNKAAEAKANKNDPTGLKRKAAEAKKTADAASDPNGDALTPDPKAGALFETQKISKGLKRLANLYAEASTTKSQALAAFNSAKDALIDKMKDEGVERVLVELGGIRKAVHVEEQDVLKLETVKDETADAAA